MGVNQKTLSIFLLILSMASLIFACFVEYFMNIAPCPLCIYQRFPYLIFIILSLISLYRNTNNSCYYIAVAICAILLSGYHTGVERGVFELSRFCAPQVTIADNTSVIDFTNMLYNSHIGMCNKPALVVFGLSMTEWNLLFNITLVAIFIKFRRN